MDVNKAAVLLTSYDPRRAVIVDIFSHFFPSLALFSALVSHTGSRLLIGVAPISSPSSGSLRSPAHGLSKSSLTLILLPVLVDFLDRKHFLQSQKLSASTTKSQLTGLQTGHLRASFNQTISSFRRTILSDIRECSGGILLFLFFSFSWLIISLLYKSYLSSCALTFPISFTSKMFFCLMNIPPSSSNSCFLHLRIHERTYIFSCFRRRNNGTHARTHARTISSPFLFLIFSVLYFTLFIQSIHSMALPLFLFGFS